MNRAMKKRLKRLLRSSPPAISRVNTLQETVDTIYSQQYRRTLEILDSLAHDNAGTVAKALAHSVHAACAEAQMAATRLYPEVPVQLNCRASCAWCCYEQLQVHILDAVGVAASLSAPLDYQLETRNGNELKKIFRPCPFLGADTRCTVYKHRPLVCRAYHSIDVTECQRVVESQEAARQVPMNIRYYGFPGLVQEATLKVFEELTIDRRPVVLGLAVATLSRDFDRITAHWLAGGDAFEETTVS